MYFKPSLAFYCLCAVFKSLCLTGYSLSYIKTDKSDYMIDSKPIDEYVDDIYTVIDLALEEERLEILIWVTIVAVLLTIAVTLFILLKTPLLELI